MMDHYFDKLLQIAAFDPSVVKNSYLIAEQKERVEPLVKICLAWGKTGKVPEKLILSYDEAPNSKPEQASNGAPKKTEGSKTKKVGSPRISLLRKQIIRQRVFQSLRILQLRAKLKRQEKRVFQTKDASSQTYEVNKRFVEVASKAELRTRMFTLSLVVPSSIVDNAQSLELKTYLVG
jgi:hypothetical protein